VELATRIELVTSSLPRKYSTTEPREQCALKNGAGEEVRTLDPQLGRLVLYQLSYTRLENFKDQNKNGGAGWIRTTES
jgi:hypothetical protein